jgi:hypothetical protein
MAQFKNSRILMIAAFLVGFNYTFAQFTGGGRIGVNASNLRGSSVENNSMLIGYNIGGFVNAGGEDILKGDIAEILSLQAELTIETKGATMDYPILLVPADTIAANVISRKINMTYVTIPIIAKFTFGDKKSLNYFAEAGFYGGGLFGVVVDGEKKYDHDLNSSTDKRNYRDDYDGFDLGIVVGGGLSIPFGGRKSPWRAYANLRYSLGLSSVGEFREGTPDVYEKYVNDIKVSAISLLFGVSYKLKVKS